MTTLLLSHPSTLNHLTPPGHPERPDRIRAVDEILSESRFDPLVRELAPGGARVRITPNPAGRWAFASSMTPRSPHATPSVNTASAAPPWSISTSTTAT